MTEQGLLERAKRLGIDIKDTKSMVDSLEGAPPALDRLG